jgi:hypothetical protein
MEQQTQRFVLFFRVSFQFHQQTYSSSLTQPFLLSLSPLTHKPWNLISWCFRRRCYHHHHRKSSLRNMVCFFCLRSSTLLYFSFYAFTTLNNILFVFHVTIWLIIVFFRVRVWESSISQMYFPDLWDLRGRPFESFDHIAIWLI